MVGGAHVPAKGSKIISTHFGPVGVSAQSWNVRHGVAEQISCGCRCAGILVDVVAICPGEGQPRAQDDSPRGNENVCLTTGHGVVPVSGPNSEA